jgi:hypothetical protein
MELPTTFEPQPSEKAPAWFRWAAIGCGVVVLGMAVMLVWSALRADRFIDWGLRRLVARTMASLPAEVPQAARDEVQKKLDCALDAAASHRVPPSRIGELARACREALEDKQVSMTELEAIDRLAGAICAQGQGQEQPEAPK